MRVCGAADMLRDSKAVLRAVVLVPDAVDIRMQGKGAYPQG